MNVNSIASFYDKDEKLWNFSMEPDNWNNSCHQQDIWNAYQSGWILLDEVFLGFWKLVAEK